MGGGEGTPGVLPVAQLTNVMFPILAPSSSSSLVLRRIWAPGQLLLSVVSDDLRSSEALFVVADCPDSSVQSILRSSVTE
jgi:hypothetical protein